jgi:hypothetical protein
MDMELLRQILTTTGPMGLLAYGMFRHHTQAMQTNAERLVELVGDRKAERDQMVSVVKENTAATTALIERLNHVRVDDVRPRNNA